MRPSNSSLPVGERSPDSSPPHPPAKKRKRPSVASAETASVSQPPPLLARKSSIQNLFSAQASAGASQSASVDSSLNRKKPKTQPPQMQSEMYSFSTKLATANPPSINTNRRLSGKLNRGFTPKNGSTKLVVKTLKPQPAWDANKYFEETWAQLDQALNVIFTQAPVNFSMEELYRGVENLCRQKRADDVYSKLSNRCKQYVRGTMKTSLLSKQRQSNVQV
ncbi:hypothetical protein KCU73_g16141, partial [Aureobasidium melanogenum]